MLPLFYANNRKRSYVNEREQLDKASRIGFVFVRHFFLLSVHIFRVMFVVPIVSRAFNSICVCVCVSFVDDFVVKAKLSLCPILSILQYILRHKNLVVEWPTEFHLIQNNTLFVRCAHYPRAEMFFRCQQKWHYYTVVENILCLFIDIMSTTFIIFDEIRSFSLSLSSALSHTHTHTSLYYSPFSTRTLILAILLVRFL